MDNKNRNVNENQNNNIKSGSQKQFQVTTVLLYGVPIVSLIIESQERLCLAQISNTLLKAFSYNEIHNRRVALGITCVQCTPVQLEILRRAGAMPVSSRRCGMITRREAERLCKSFLGDNAPPRLPEDFIFSVHHECAWGCSGSFIPSRYNSSRAKCIKCNTCSLYFSPNKFIFHSHRTGSNSVYVQPDAANFNSWRRHMKLVGKPSEDVIYAWEDVKAMFNGGTRKRLTNSSTSFLSLRNQDFQDQIMNVNSSEKLTKNSELKNDHGNLSPTPLDLVYQKQFNFNPYMNSSTAVTAAASLPWLKRAPLLFTNDIFLKSYPYDSAFKPICPISSIPDNYSSSSTVDKMNYSNSPEENDDEVDIETTDDKDIICSSNHNKNMELLVKTDGSNSFDHFWSFPKFSFQYAAAAAAAAATALSTGSNHTVSEPKRLMDYNASTSITYFSNDNKYLTSTSKPFSNVDLLQSIKMNDKCNLCQNDLNKHFKH